MVRMINIHYFSFRQIAKIACVSGREGGLILFTQLPRRGVCSETGLPVCGVLGSTEAVGAAPGLSITKRQVPSDCRRSTSEVCAAPVFRLREVCAVAVGG